MELASHAVKLLDVSPSSNKILGLDLAGAHLAILRARFDLLDKGLLLLLQLDAGLVEFADGFIKHALVLAQTLGGRHALTEGPFEDLHIHQTLVLEARVRGDVISLTFMLAGGSGGEGGQFENNSRTARQSPKVGECSTSLESERKQCYKA